MEGVKVDGWTIKPLVYPMVSLLLSTFILYTYSFLQQITKKQVDHFKFKPGSFIPRCPLIVTPPAQVEQTVDLLYHIKIIGARPPRNIFTVSLSPKG